MKTKKKPAKDKKPTSKKGQQKPTDYRPTVAERRLLEILLNPEHRLKSVAEICRLAKCDRCVYYDGFNKPDFVAYYKKESCRLVDKALAPVINASIRQAIRGDSAHTKILLTMSGSYTDKHAFIGKDGQPQDLNPKQEFQYSELERAARFAFYLQTAHNKLKEFEEKDGAESGGKG